MNEKNSANASERIEAIEPFKPDFFEIRLDLMEDTNEIELIRNSTNVPLIATNRPKKHELPNNGKRRIDLLIQACEKGYDYIDFDINNRSIEKSINSFRDSGAKLILSNHDFGKTPDINELTSIMNKQTELGADICKIIGTVNQVQDNLIYLKFLQKNINTNLVSFGMGAKGIMSRIFSPFYGGVFTYASAETGREAAEGQLTISELKQIYRLLRI
jgi:3-dehydroquinate dehydratase type I